MPVTRRAFLTAGGAAAATAAVVPAASPGGPPGAVPRPRVAWAAGRTAPLPAPSPEHHLLSRAAYGATPAEAARVRAMGTGAWIDEQLAPASVDDAAVDAALANFLSIGWSAAEIRANRGTRPVRNELIAATLYRAVNSRRQLLEVMVDHWSNVFNVFHPEEFISASKTVEDRDVIRRHALGTFRELLHASAQSPAMMRYLDTVRNTRTGPNENYAREVMELHTLGVDGGYTEADIKDVARCFTGWTYNGTSWAFEFRAADHDSDAKTVLGRPIRSSGIDEGHEVLDRLVDHPSCARHVARRLVRRFVADDPPEDLVADVAAVFGKDGDIPAMLRAILTSETFKRGHAGAGGWAPAKVRRPLEYWVAVLRAIGADTSFMFEVPKDVYEGDDTPGAADYTGRAEAYLQQMDQIPFRWLSPNGYPDVGPRWGGMHVVVARWNYAYAVASGALEGIRFDWVERTRAAGVPFAAAAVVDHWADRLLGRGLLPADRQLLVDFVARGNGGTLSAAELGRRLPSAIALMFDSPYFQRR